MAERETKTADTNYDLKQHWVVGVGFLALALMFIGLVMVLRPEPVPGQRQLVTCFVAVTLAGAFWFLGGDAAAKGHLPILQTWRLQTTGGLAAFVIVLSIGSFLYPKSDTELVHSNVRENLKQLSKFPEDKVSWYTRLPEGKPPDVPQYKSAVHLVTREFFRDWLEGFRPELKVDEYVGYLKCAVDRAGVFFNPNDPTQAWPGLMQLQNSDWRILKQLRTAIEEDARKWKVDDLEIQKSKPGWGD